MSRVTYTDQTATSAQEALRGANKVRLVTEAEEGTGVNALPAGVYGFTYSPGPASAPLFAVRRYRSFEIHADQIGYGTFKTKTQSQFSDGAPYAQVGLSGSF